MKRSVLLIITALVCASAYVLLDDSNDINAETPSAGECGTGVTYSFDTASGTLTITGSGDIADYTESTAPWNSYRTQIRSVVIGDSVTTLGDYAFAGCTSLATVQWGGSLATINQFAFSGCTSITEITIPKSVTLIEEYAFWGCDSLASINVDEQSSHYSSVDGVLYDGDKTNLIKYPAARDGTSYNISAIVTYVDEDAFWGCSKLTSFTVESENEDYKAIGGVLYSVDQIDSEDDYGYVTTEEEVYLSAYPAGKTDGSYTIPGDVVGVDSQFVFCGCKNLKTVVLDDGIEVTGNMTAALAACPALENITVSSNSDYVFENGVLYSKDKTTLVLCLATKSGVFDIPAGTVNIADYAFVNACGITVLNIPDSVTSFKYGTFFGYTLGGFGCKSLCKITFGNGLNDVKYAFVNMSLIGTDGQPLDVTSENLKGKTFYLCNGTLKTGFDPEIPEEGHVLVADSATEGKKCSLCGKTFGSQSGTGTGDGSGTSGGDTSGGSDTGGSDVKSGECGKDVTYSFNPDTGILTIDGSGDMEDYSEAGAPWNSYKTQIKSVVVKGTVTALAKNAFYKCTSLTSVDLGSSITKINSSVFSGCIKLTSVTIPATVTNIQIDAFHGCDALVSIAVAEGNHNFSQADGVLFNSDKTKLILYPASKTDTSYDVPSSVTSLGNYAFSGCRFLTTVNLGSAEYTGYYAFEGCSALTKVDLGSLNSVNDYAFQNCTSLSEVNFGSVTTLGESSFSGCTSLASVEFPSKLTTVGKSAFYGCTNLGKVTLDEALTGIGEYAFGDCTSLTDITIPKSVTSIGDFVFWNCASLTKIEVDDTNEKYSDVDGILFDKTQYVLIKYPAAKTVSADPTYIVPNSVGYIKADAFWGCTNLQSFAVAEESSFVVVGGVLCKDLEGQMYLVAYPAGRTSETYEIPDNVSEVSNYYVFSGSKALKKVVLNDNITVSSNVSVALAYCPALETIEVKDSNTKYVFDNGVLFSKDKKTLVLCLSTKSGVYDVPVGTETIEGYAFANASKITALNIPDSVSKIVYNAFHCPEFGGFGCSSLCSITFGNGLNTIDSGAFGKIAFYADDKSLDASVDNLKEKSFAVCNGTIETGFDYPDGGHVLKNVEEVSSTDSADGVKEHQSCSVCGKNFLNGKEASEADLKIPMGSGSGTSGGSGSTSDSGSTGDSGSSGDSGSTGDSGSSSGEGSGTGDSGSSDGTGDSDGNGKSDGNGSSNSTNVTVAIGSILAILVLVGAYVYYRRMN